MKITLIGPVYPYKGGITHFTQQLNQEFSKKHEVQLISWKRRYPSFLVKNQVENNSSEVIKKNKSVFVLDYLNPLTWIKVVKLIKRNKSKFVFFNWVSPAMTPVFYPLTIMIKLFSKAKPIFICHCAKPHEGRLVDSFLTKLSFSNVDYFVAHSSDEAVEVKKMNKKCSVITSFLPNFNNFDKVVLSEQLKIDMGLKKRTILFFGYIREYKGLWYLIKAMPEIVKQLGDITLLIVGEFWEDKKRYLDLIKDNNLEDSIVLIDNYVPDKEVGKYFVVSDLLVLPYLTTTQSAIVQTAYHFNKPCVVTDVGGLSESVKDDYTGYLVPPKDASALARAAVNFYKLNKKENFIENVKVYKQNFSWEKYLGLIEDRFLNSSSCKCKKR